MYPWLWIFAPQLHFPWSGSVAQQIDPDTSWFFNSIPTQAGNGSVEKKAFQVASYGRQLGLITEILIELAEKNMPLSVDGASSLERLKTIRAEIERIKATDTESLVSDIEAALTRLQRSNKAEFALVKERLQPFFAEAGA